jgi:hypothetical protein
MEIIKFMGIGEDTLDIEGAIEGVGSQHIEGASATFKIESPSTNKILEIRVQKNPFWVFSIGAYNGDFMKNPRWRNSRVTQSKPLLTEILTIEVPEDSIVEKIN